MNRSFDDRRRYERGIHEMHGYPSQEGYPANEGSRAREGYPERRPHPTASTYGNVPYDQLPERLQTDAWRGRDEQHDFWGMDRHSGHHPEHVARDGDHPSLWQRVKGAFHGKGPKNYARSDDRIHEDVCEHLTYHPYVDASDIEVVVRDGEVTLSGTVEARMVKRAAEECCEHVRGVTDVHNHLRVRRPETTAAR